LLGLVVYLSSPHPSVAAEAKKTTAAASAPAKAATTTGTVTKKTAPAAFAPKATAPRLSAAEVVKKHLSARGGLQAWRAVQTLSMSGNMDAGSGDSIARSTRAARGPGAMTSEARREIAAGAQKGEAAKQVQLPFTLATQRPNKSRLEIAFAGKTAVQVYDGTNGWKLRPYLNRNDVQPFTPEEAKIEAENADMGDPLIDYAAKGSKVGLVGIEKVEGHDAYKLELTTKTGTVRHIWIDARSFLDVKVEGVPRRMDGKMHTVWVYQRDFRSVQGLKIPFVLETAVEGYPQTHRIVLDKVVVNPQLAAATFAKPKA
jgi:outer membrane lipoprotein-sorting protein